jgi:hypothetical protein
LILFYLSTILLETEEQMKYTQDEILAKVAESTGLEISEDVGLFFHIMNIPFGKPRAIKGAFCQLKEMGFSKNAIFMNLDRNDPYWYNVLFHELAHSTGIKFNRPGVVILENRLLTDRNWEEVLAETVAMRLMEYFGMATEETRAESMKYIESYNYGGMLDFACPCPELNTWIDESYNEVLKHVSFIK